MNKTYLVHHGIKGQRWGIRRFQNEDGSLTPAGKKKYSVNEDGTMMVSDKYRKHQKIKGGIKVAVGAALAKSAVTGVAKYVSKSKNKKTKIDFSSRSGKKTLNKAIFATALGAIVISSGVKNFLDSRKSMPINTVGMGPTPETLTMPSQNNKKK